MKHRSVLNFEKRRLKRRKKVIANRLSQAVNDGYIVILTDPAPALAFMVEEKLSDYELAFLYGVRTFEWLRRGAC